MPDNYNAYNKGEYFSSIPVPKTKIFSTIGAGDAMHAGFLKEWIYGNGNLRQSVVYSQIVAAVSISNTRATHGIDKYIVEDMFQRIW